MASAGFGLRHSRGRPNGAITHENRVGLDPYGWETPGKIGADRPVGHRPSPIQHARLGQ